MNWLDPREVEAWLAEREAAVEDTSKRWFPMSYAFDQFVRALAALEKDKDGGHSLKDEDHCAVCQADAATDVARLLVKAMNGGVE